MSTRKEELKKQIGDLEAQLLPLKRELNELHQADAEAVENKVQRCLKGEDKFELSELVFAATVRCECGAGMAYPKNTGVHGRWDCSDILLGRAIHSGQEGSKTHSSAMPFMFYEIKSEHTNSAYGATTRPDN